MALTVPSAKISRPAPDSAFARTRLFQRLDEARARPVVSVSGPPGCGKTTLVSSYIGARGLRHLWYQLDEGDTDVASFFYYLAQAASARPGGPTLPTLTPESRPALFARRFFRELFALLPAPAVLVLDDLPELTLGSELEQALQVAFAEAPAGVSIILISRGAPHALLSRQLARGAVASLEGEELRLSAEEGLGIASGRGGADGLGAERVRRIGELCDGWAAGLVLMLEQSLAAAPVDGPPDWVDRELVFEYFAGEVFERRSPPFQQFLLRTAFLPRVSVPLAQRLTGEPQAEAYLRELAASNYFTVRRPGPVPSYEYHPLFREFLRQRAALSLNPDALAQVQRRAARLLLEAGDSAGAAGLFIASQDWEGLARLAREQAADLLLQGRRRTLLAWLEPLPEACIRQDPWLLFWQGSCLFPYQVEAGRRAFADAYRGFRRQGDAGGAYRALVAVMETYFYLLDDLRPLDQWLTEMRGLLAAQPAMPCADVEAQVAYGMLSGLMWREPGGPELPQWVARAQALLAAEDVPVRQRVLLGNALFLYHLRWRGDLVRGGMILDQVRPLVRGQGSTPYTRILWKMMQATYASLTNAPDEGLRAVRRGLGLARRTGVQAFDFLMVGLGVYCHLVKGDTAAASRDLTRLKSLQRPGGNAEIAHVHYLSAWVALERDELARARDHALLALRHAEASDARVTHGYHLATLAQVLLESGESAEAAPLLARAWRSARRLGNGFLLHHCQLARAQLALASGQRQRALTALARGLAAGRRGGYLSPPGLGWRRQILGELLRTALEHHIEPDYACSLIRERNLLPATPPLDVEAWPWPVKLRLLGQPQALVDGKPRRLIGKSLELLRLLAAAGAGRSVNVGTVVDALWPDADGDAAYHSFETSLYRVRKLLGAVRAVEFQDRRIGLDPAYCWVDVWAVEHLIRRLEAALTAAAADEVDSLGRRLLALLEQPDPDQLELGPPGLLPQLLRMLERLGRFWEERQDWDQATDCYRAGLTLDPAGEVFHRQLTGARARPPRAAAMVVS